MDWRIYYDDGSTFDSGQGTPQDAPALGVICIVYPDELVGRVIMHRFDWYYWVADDEQQWWGSDIHGLTDRLIHNLPTEAVKEGRSVSHRYFREIITKADKDPDFPPKSGKNIGEKP